METYMAWQALDGVTGHDMGRLLLRQLYEAYVGGEMPALCIAPKGKPYFADSPWHFSISHTKHYAFCVLSDRSVGVDAEELARKVRPSIASKILSPGEYEQYQQADDPQRALLSFWVLKEATAKQTGEGIRIHPNHTDFSLPDQRVQQVGPCLVAIVHEQ